MQYRKASETPGKGADDDIYSVISEMSASGSVEAFGSVRRTRPLSPVRMKSGNVDADDDASFFSSTASGRERRARASPYLKHLDERSREERLIELGSVSLSRDLELNAEMQLKAMLKTVIGDTKKLKPSPIKLRTNNRGGGGNASTNASMNNSTRRGGGGGGLGKSRDRGPNPTLGTTTGTDASDVTDDGGYDEDNWWEGGFAGVSDEYTGFVMDLSPSVSTASSDHSWSRTEISADGVDYSFTRTGEVPEDY
jgi:hypothetical protein